MAKKNKEQDLEVIIEDGLLDDVEIVESVLEESVVEPTEVIEDIKEDPIVEINTSDKCECDGATTMVRNRLGSKKICVKCGLAK